MLVTWFEDESTQPEEGRPSVVAVTAAATRDRRPGAAGGAARPGRCGHASNASWSPRSCCCSATARRTGTTWRSHSPRWCPTSASTWATSTGSSGRWRRTGSCAPVGATTCPAGSSAPTSSPTMVVLCSRRGPAPSTSCPTPSPPSGGATRKEHVMHHSIHRHIHHHHYGRDLSGRSERSWRRGRRRYDDLDAVIAFLEERQRDLEQAAADVAAKVQRLKERRDARTASTPEGTARVHAGGRGRPGRTDGRELAAGALHEAAVGHGGHPIGQHAEPGRVGHDPEPVGADGVDHHGRHVARRQAGLGQLRADPLLEAGVPLGAFDGPSRAVAVGLDDLGVDRARGTAPSTRWATSPRRARLGPSPTAPPRRTWPRCRARCPPTPGARRRRRC